MAKIGFDFEGAMRHLGRLSRRTFDAVKEKAGTSESEDSATVDEGKPRSEEEKAPSGQDGEPKARQD